MYIIIGLRRVASKKGILFALALAAWPAASMAQVNTDCIRNPMGWSCQTYDPNQGWRDIGTVLGNIMRQKREREAAEAEAARIAAQQAGLRAQQDEYARQTAYAQQQQQLAVQREQDFMGVVSQAIQQGECEDAKAIALSRNRLDVADQAMRLCVPKRVAPTRPDARKHNLR